MQFIELEEIWEVNPAEVMAKRPNRNATEHQVWAVYCAKGARDHCTDVKASMPFLLEETGLDEETIREVLQVWANLGAAFRKGKLP